MRKDFFVKKCFFVFLLLILFWIACKKSNVNYNSFTLYENGDSSWTTTNVTTVQQSDSVVEITAINAATNEKVIFDLNGYRDGRKTYYIGGGSVPGNSYGSSAAYQGITDYVYGYGGQIAITAFATHTMNGTFDFQGDTIHFTGSFKAPLP